MAITIPENELRRLLELLHLGLVDIRSRAYAIDDPFIAALADELEHLPAGIAAGREDLLSIASHGLQRIESEFPDQSREWSRALRRPVCAPFRRTDESS